MLNALAAARRDENRTDLLDHNPTVSCTSVTPIGEHVLVQPVTSADLKGAAMLIDRLKAGRHCQTKMVR